MTKYGGVSYIGQIINCVFHHLSFGDVFFTHELPDETVVYAPKLDGVALLPVMEFQSMQEELSHLRRKLGYRKQQHRQLEKCYKHQLKMNARLNMKKLQAETELTNYKRSMHEKTFVVPGTTDFAPCPACGCVGPHYCAGPHSSSTTMYTHQGRLFDAGADPVTESEDRD